MQSLGPNAVLNESDGSCISGRGSRFISGGGGDQGNNNGGGACLICHSKKLGRLSTSFSFGPPSSPILSAHLKVYVLFVHILQLPSEQFEIYLINCPKPEDWVKVCVDCSENYLDKCEKVFLELLEAKRRFADSRWELVRAIKRSVEAEKMIPPGGAVDKGDNHFILDIDHETRNFVGLNEYTNFNLNEFISGDLLATEKLMFHKAREDKVTLNEDFVKTSEQLKEEPPSPPSPPHYSDAEDYKPGNYHAIASNLKQAEGILSSESSDSDDTEGSDVDFSPDNLEGSSTEEETGPFSSDSRPPKECKSKVSTRLTSERRATLNKASLLIQKKYRNKNLKSGNKTGTRNIQYKCIKCEYNTIYGNLLRAHMKRYHGNEKDLDDLTCLICHKISSSARNLKSHMRTVHNDKREKRLCEHCDKTFLNKETWRDHLASAHGVKTHFRHQCFFEGCGKFYFRQNSLKQHEATHRPPQFGCKLCGEKFRSSTTLKRHSKLHEYGERKPFQCEFCFAKFSRNDNLMAHVRNVHEGTNAAEKSSMSSCKHPGFRHRSAFRCSECDLVFNFKSHVKRHLDVFHNGVGFVKEDGNAAARKRNLKQSKVEGILRVGHKKRTQASGEVQTSVKGKGRRDAIKRCNKVDEGSNVAKNGRKRGHHKDLKELTCPKCKRVFRSKYNLQLHATKPKCNITHELVEVKCAHCDETFLFENSLRGHMKTVHGITDARIFKCSVDNCEKLFPTKRMWYRHDYKHKRGLDKQKCHICGLVMQKTSLRGHIQVKHEKVAKPQFLCEQCPAIYASKAYLKYHVNLAHTPIDTTEGKREEFRCDICKTSYVSKSSLQAHIDRVHEMKLQVCCDLCGKILRSYHYMKLHKARVHKIDAHILPKFECSVEGCSKVFGFNNHLKKHILAVHEGQRPFQCETCGKHLTSRYHLKRHITAMHSESRDCKPVKCGECGKGFAIKEYLWLHMKTHQTKE